MKETTVVDQWSYNSKTDSAILSGTGTVVLYVEDIKPEVIAELIQMHNTGSSTEQIQKWLDKHPDVTMDESDYIVEQMNNYLATNKNVETEKIYETVLPNGNKVIDKEDKKYTEDAANSINTIPNIQPTVGNIADTATNQEQKTDKPKQTRTKRSTGTTTGKVSAEDLIKALQDKIELLQVFNAMEAPEVPSGVNKVARELIIEFQGEYEALVGKYLETISKM